MTLSFEQYLASLQTEGDLFAAAIAAAAPDAPIPMCPDWTMADLVRHTGGVHRWATTIIRGALAKPSLIPADFLGALRRDCDRGADQRRCRRPRAVPRERPHSLELITPA